MTKAQQKKEESRKATEAYYARQRARREHTSEREIAIMDAVLDLVSQGKMNWPDSWSERFFPDVLAQSEYQSLTTRQSFFLWKFLAENEMERFLPEFKNEILLAQSLIELAESVMNAKMIDHQMQELKTYAARCFAAIAERRAAILEDRLSALPAARPASADGNDSAPAA